MIALLLVLAGMAGAFYITLGYPLLLSRVRSRKSPAVRKDSTWLPSVSALLAVYNGEREIAAKLDTLVGLDYPPDRFQIVVISDGSTDETVRAVLNYERNLLASGRVQPAIVVVEAPRGGKSAALNRGMEKATGEILFFTDLRQQLNSGALRHLVANLADPTVGAVTGEMHLRGGDTGEQADMDLYWRYEIWARTRQSEIDSLFNCTGCIYAMRRSLAQPLPPDTLTDDAVLPLRAFFAGYRVVFDPAAIAWDSPAIAGTEFRRRFRTLAGLWQVFVRMPLLFTGQNRMRWHFLSHKFGRVALPWSLLLAFFATLAMPSGKLRTGLLVFELTPLVFAVLNTVVPRNFPLKRLTSPARTFLVMNLAALAALAVFFIPAQKIWKPTKTK